MLLHHQDHPGAQSEAYSGGIGRYTSHQQTPPQADEEGRVDRGVDGKVADPGCGGVLMEVQRLLRVEAPALTHPVVPQLSSSAAAGATAAGAAAAPPVCGTLLGAVGEASSAAKRQPHSTPRAVAQLQQRPGARFGFHGAADITHKQHLKAANDLPAPAAAAAAVDGCGMDERCQCVVEHLAAPTVATELQLHFQG